MNRSERLIAILDLLAESGKVEVDQIVATLGASAATARRDLDALAEQQLLTRTHGGGVARSVAYDLPLRYKNQQNPDRKVAIARAASKLVPRGSIVGLCGGTTTTTIADELMSRADIMEQAVDPGLTIVTNAINIGMQLAARPQIKTVLTGGIVHTRSYELVGAQASATLNSMNLDIAFIGANALDAANGASGHDERESVVNVLMAARASHAVLVIDSSKIGKRAFAKIGGSETFQTVITDAGIRDEDRLALRDAGYVVIVAEG